ncbi:hypothetical protein GF366_02785 [Candidatus Peregrinibacteria bacterium]|nr:hypothetical protein [Candidatus Peregrinibacteria bacterium]
MSRNKKRERKVFEFWKGKTRTEEEKFSEHFSEVQLNSILLLILGATFLVQGIISYLKLIGEAEYIRPWFTVILVALMMLVFSVILVTLGWVLSPLKLKRSVNLLSFLLFVIGSIVFLASLIYLLIVI